MYSRQERVDFISGMEQAGRLAAEILQYVGRHVKVGITTDDLNKIGHEYTLSRGAKPAPLGYRGYPKSLCTSVNEVICHGVPNNTILKNGDIINIDITAILNGYHGDTSSMFFVGETSDKAKELCYVAQEARDRGIEAIEAGAMTGDVGFEINKFVTKKGFYVVKEIGGHGIGTIFHDEPFVPSHGKKGRGDALKPWTCITIEPMVNETSAPIKEVDIAGSSHKIYLTGDGSLSAQYEHTVLITDSGYQIMTLS